MIAILKVGVPVLSIVVSLLSILTAGLAISREASRNARINDRLAKTRGSPIVEDFSEPSSFAFHGPATEVDEG